MKKNWIDEVKKFLKNQNSKTLKKVSLVLLALSVALSINHALSLPAITREGTLICAQEEHVHDINCYETDTQLTCTNQEEDHHHDESCYTSQEKLVCLKTEHTHTDTCYEKAEDKSQENTESVKEESQPKKAQARAAEQPVNLNPDWISHVEIKGQGQWDTNNWQNVNDGDVLKDNQQLKFKMEYEIPSGTLAENNYVEYQLPDVFVKVTPASGDITNEYSEKIGTYTISEDGKVTLRFDEETLKKHEFSAIEGTFTFECNASQLKKDENDEYKIPFNQEMDFTFKKEEEKSSSEDLSGWKTQSEYDKEKGTITYTITINSKEGTSDSVHLKDIMENVSLDGEIQIEYTHNNEKKNVTDQYSPKKTENGFDVELNKMEAGDSYTITYTAKVENPLEEAAVLTKNKIHVSSKDHNEKELEFESNVEKNINFKDMYTYLSKEYTGEDAQNHKLNWKIVVNPENQDIGEMTLKDYLNGRELKGQTVTIDPPITDEKGEKQSQITLPFTFPKGTKEKYTLTYSTDDELEIGTDHAANKVVLSNPKGEDKETTAWSWGHQKYYPIEKKGTSIKPSEDRSEVIIDWKLKIEASKGEIRGSDGSEKWSYEDKLENNQYFSKEQFETLAAEIKKNDLVENVVEMEVWDGKIHAFKVTFKKPLPKGSTLEFTYSSTGPLNDPHAEANYRNTARINDKEWIGDTITYTPSDPTIQKIDADNNSVAGDTTHDLDQLKEQKLKWYLNLTIPKGYKDGDLTITEKLPEGILLTDLKYQDIDLHPDRITENTDFKVSQDKAANTVSIVIDQNYIESHKLEQMQFLVEGQIAKDFEGWTADSSNSAVETAVFKNGVSVSTEIQKDVDTDVQIQTIKKDGNKNILIKKGSQNGSAMTYLLEINPEGKDLLEGQDTLTLVDELKFYMSNDTSFDMFLVPNSVKVYKYDEEKPDHKGAQLPKESCPYTYSTKTEHGWFYKILELTIPDSMPLVIEYKYSCNVTDFQYQNMYQKSVQNTATIKGLTISDNKNTVNSDVKIEESSATARLTGLSLIKVDDENNALTLPGAKFKLEVWDKEAKEYVSVKDGDSDYILTSDMEGRIHLSLAGRSSSNKDLLYNTAYRLVEIEAPENYKLNSKPYEFYFLKQSQEEKSIPEDFKGAVLNGGATIYYENTSNETEISVVKNWKDENGNILVNPSASPIYFYVYQKLEMSASSADSLEKGTVTISCPEAKNSEWNTFYEDFSKKYPLGTKVTYRITKYHPDNQDRTSIQINGTSYPMHYEQGNFTYTNKYNQINTATEKAYTDFTLTVEKDTKAVLKVNSADNSWWTLEEVKVESPSGSTGEEEAVPYLGQFTLSQSNNWQMAIKNLPKQVTKTDENGHEVSYDCSYYVKEVSGVNEEYVNNGGIVSGMIQIINDFDTPPPSETRLPQTGGETVPILGSGLIDAALITMAALYIVILLKYTGKE